MNPTDTLSARLDAYGRRHPGAMLALLMALTALAVLALLYHSDAPYVLYQAF